ncbi:MAG: zinc ribbon domain-containing protein [Solitalea-like symbiont of Acarus siro]
MTKTIVDTLRSLYTLQTIHSKIDELHFKRGELPEEISDLECEISGIQINIQKIKDAIKEATVNISQYKNDNKIAEEKITQYEEQKNDVKNNREYEAIEKEIETQVLSIQVNDKRIKTLEKLIEDKTKLQKDKTKDLEVRKQDLELKVSDLSKIIEETKSEENVLEKKTEAIKKQIEERLLISYDRLRNNYKNKLAVVTIDRNACSGCHSEIPPQKLSDIRQLKNLIVCEQCGRIIVDDGLAEEIRSTVN